MKEYISKNEESNMRLSSKSPDKPSCSFLCHCSPVCRGPRSCPVVPAAAPPDSTHLHRHHPLNTQYHNTHVSLLLCFLGALLRYSLPEIYPLYAYLLYQYIRADNPKRKQSLDQVYLHFKDLSTPLQELQKRNS